MINAHTHIGTHYMINARTRPLRCFACATNLSALQIFLYFTTLLILSALQILLYFTPVTNLSAMQIFLLLCEPSNNCFYK